MTYLVPISQQASQYQQKLFRYQDQGIVLVGGEKFKPLVQGSSGSLLELVLICTVATSLSSFISLQPLFSVIHFISSLSMENEKSVQVEET